MLDWWLPKNASTYGADIDWLFYVVYYLTNITFFVVQGALLWFLIKYRARPGRRAVYTHGNLGLEIVWTIVPSLILVVLALISRASWAEIKQNVPPTDFVVRVTAKQFNWEITYPGPDAKFDTADDFTQDNDFHVPVHKKVRLILKSKDVIHSFFIPNLRFKQDTVPGHEILAWFEATEPGRYEVPCAELCGFGHSGMRGWLHVDTPEQYAAWAREHNLL